MSLNNFDLFYDLYGNQQTKSSISCLRRVSGFNSMQTSNTPGSPIKSSNVESPAKGNRAS